MYLKRVEAVGFKSFAQKVNIEFKYGVNGIVGPNGCGKSNITDAIKWVLGEQSTKNLRASGMTDVIFAGSEAYKRHNFAQVSLIFDNSVRLFNLDFDEVQITRKVYRDGESEYLINNVHCRLKDINDLILDTGLGKDSLSMISQGGISNFAQAKPDERRLIFEEAAGVSKYKKRKTESLKKLDKTAENLTRIEDIISEIEIQIEPLKIQSLKAQKFLDKKNRLEEIEVSVLVYEIDNLNNELIIKNSAINDIEYNAVTNSNELMNIDTRLQNQKNSIKEYDFKIESLQQKLLDIIDNISTIEKQIIDGQQNNQVLFDENEDVSYYKKNLVSLDLEINNIKSNLLNIKDEIISSKLSYNDKKENYESLRNEIVSIQNGFQSLLANKEMLENMNASNSNLFNGVKAIIGAKNSLNGIVGIVNDLFEVDELYMEAISKTLGTSLQNIVCQSSDDAKDAVNFLKKNQAGRATFIPISELKPKSIGSDDIHIAKSVVGYIDIATNLVTFKEDYRLAFEYLLNNSLVCDNIDNAIILARKLRNKYRVVTLDGEVISVGGLVTGGKNRNNQKNILNSKKDLEKIVEEISSKKFIIDSKNNLLYSLESEVDNLRSFINKLEISQAKLEENLNNKEQSYFNIKEKYDMLTDDEFKIDYTEKQVNLQNSLTNSLNSKEKVINEIKSLREVRLELSKEIDKQETKYKSIQRLLNDLSQKENEYNLVITKLEMSKKSLLDRLALEYQLTYDTALNQMKGDLILNQAKIEVDKLKSEIRRLGVVNLLAIDEYEKIRERYDFLGDQYNDLVASKEEILKTISDTDKVMVQRFSKTIDDINEILPDMFKKLFGGGYANLEYSNPMNILESGIEIVARPPGKSIQNLNLFSGGEKALIALSVLFSILKVRPVPLCILDEVEAALDQANVERFARFLKEFAEQTQFIVITHRPGTMEECDVLYGVTMQEKGVTKMVGVKLEDAKDLIEKEI